MRNSHRHGCKSAGRDARPNGSKPWRHVTERRARRSLQRLTVSTLAPVGAVREPPVLCLVAQTSAPMVYFFLPNICGRFTTILEIYLIFGLKKITGSEACAWSFYIVRHDGAEGGRCHSRLRAPAAQVMRGRPLGLGLQDQGPNHRMLLRPNGRGGERDGKGRVKPVRWELGRRTRVNRRGCVESVGMPSKTGSSCWPVTKLGGSLSTARAMAGMKAARAQFRLLCGTWEPSSSM